MSISLHTLAFFFPPRGKTQKGISLVSGSSAAEISIKDAQEKQPQNTTTSTKRMARSLEFNHCVMLLKSFSNLRAFLESSGCREHPKNYLLGFFSLLSSFSFPISFGFPLQKGQRTLPEQHLFHGRPKTCPSGLCQESPLGLSLPA